MALEEAVQEHQRKVENEPESDVFECSDDSDDDSYDGSDDDSGDDPSYDIVEETSSALSKLSVSKPISSKCKDADAKKKSGMEIKDVGSEIPKLDEKDEKTYEMVEELIKGGDLEKLKVDQCKIYLRKYGLRLTGKKDVLISRIAEHREIIDGCGEKKYPPESFVLNCKGDACLGDVVIFEQNVYEMFSIASRSATGPSCGTRTVAGRIVKESYGAAKQQHTFTIEVLWSKGEKPWPPLHPLLIKGRNLYRIKTMRQRWADEGERQKVLQEKHARGFYARSSRDRRLQEKEMRKNGMLIKRNKFTGDKENHHPQTTGVHQQIRNYKDQHRHEPDMRSNSTVIANSQQIGNAAIPSILGKHPKTAEHGISLQPQKAHDYQTYLGTSQASNLQNFRYIQHRDLQHHHHHPQVKAHGFRQSLESRNGGVYAARSNDHRHHYKNANHYYHHMHQTSTAIQFVQPLQQPYPGNQKKP